MKHMIGKGVKLLTLCMTILALTLSASLGVLAEEQIDETKRQQLALTGEALTDTIIDLSDEAIAEYKDSSDKFTAAAMEAWETSRGERGQVVPDAVNGEITVTQRGSKYTVSVPKTFEKANVNFVYVFNRALDPTAITIDVKLPMGTTLSRAGMNTLMGICIVFLMLIFLSLVISLLKFIPGLVGGKKKNAPAPVPAAVPAAEPVPVPAPADDQELIAVIAAAIAAAEGTSPDGFVVRSIRKANRRK